MADSKSFLDNLNNLRLVTSVALEHIQANLTNFVKDADAHQVRQCDRSIHQIRTLAEQLEREFHTLEYLLRSPNRR
jgi:Tfp pilus assembly protein PilN